MRHEFKKKFGQNFLTNVNSAIELVEAAELKDTDTVIEIGPGNGAVSEFVLPKVKKLIAVEIDAELMPALMARFGGFENFELVNADILNFEEIKNLHGEYKVVSSLPYNISKKVISMFLEADNPPVSMTVIVQKEVAADYTSPPLKRSFLSNYAKILSDPEYVMTISKEDFFPQPEVDGAIITFKNIRPKYKHYHELIRLMKVGYSMPRKTLANNLRSAGWSKALIEKSLKELRLSETARASELTLEQWYNLRKELLAS